jgi:ElaB/YqjD/DUF883 family membrane-anchored ribosome-binding protein
MDERRLESIGDTAPRSTRRMASEAQDMASRAGGYAQDMADRAGTYVQQRARDVGRDVNDRLERLTGRPAESWMADARRFVQDHPLQAVAFTIGLGFVLGKILARD